MNEHILTGGGTSSESISSEKNWELVNFCENDKYAVQAYCAIHGVDESLNLGDITQVDETQIDDFTMMSWSFPCQDISVAGKLKGFIDEKGNCTRSGLYNEGLRILKSKQPSFSIIENVKNLVGKRFKNEFNQILNDLDSAGYNSYWQVLNSKDYGVPQNRERVFIISIRKDLDNGMFNFPIPFDNGIRLKDVLEDEVDEKYYVNTPKANQLIQELIESGKLNKEISNTVRGGGQRQHRASSMGFDTGKCQLPVKVNYSHFDGTIDIAGTLMARDYKGFGSSKETQNGVLEIGEK